MVEMNVRRNDATLEDVDRFDESRKARCGLQMANLCLGHQLPYDERMHLLSHLI